MEIAPADPVVDSTRRRRCRPVGTAGVGKDSAGVGGCGGTNKRKRRGSSEAQIPKRQLRLEECSGVCITSRPALHATVADVPKWQRRLQVAVRAGATPQKLLRRLRRLAICTKFFGREELVKALRASGAGKLCAELRRHADAEVKHFAARLVETWRKLAIGEQAPKRPRVAPDFARVPDAGAASAAASGVVAIIDESLSDADHNRTVGLGKDGGRSETEDDVSDSSSSTSSSSSSASEACSASSAAAGKTGEEHGVANAACTFRANARLCWSDGAGASNANAGVADGRAAASVAAVFDEDSAEAWIPNGAAVPGSSDVPALGRGPPEVGGGRKLRRLRRVGDD